MKTYHVEVGFRISHYVQRTVEVQADSLAAAEEAATSEGKWEDSFEDFFKDYPKIETPIHVLSDPEEIGT